MITTARPLAVRELLNKKSCENNEVSIWCMENQVEILTHRSWVSLYMIIQYTKRKIGRNPIIYVPELFCYDTLKQIESEVKIVFYKIKKDLSPDFKLCTEQAKQESPDIFLFVYFFGKVLNANDARIFCTNYNSILVEDAAHILFPSGKIGCYGHFTLYSPWKSYGTIDGAVLIINGKAKFDKGIEEIKKELENIQDGFQNFPSKKVWYWKLKKILQKILRVHKQYNRNEIRIKKNNVQKNEKEDLYKISKFSKNILMNVENNKVLQLGNTKKENYQFILEYLKEIYNVNSAFSCDSDIPYALIVKVSNIEVKKKISEKLGKIGAVVNEWPDLSPILEKDSEAANFKRETLMISIHDGINFEVLRRKLKISTEPITSDKKFCLEEITEEQYKNICKKTQNFLPLLQSSIYANSKKNTQNWKINYWKVVRKDKNRETIAFFLTLNKYHLLYRINRGPIFCQNIEMEVYELLKKKFSGFGKILFIAPNAQRNGKNFLYFSRIGFRYKKNYYSTGFIDLKKDETTIRKQMGGTWRNSLKNAEKKELKIENITCKKDFETLLHLHSMDKEIRNYEDSGDDITRYLFNSGNMIGICAKNAGNIISFILLALHGKSATYYIGWSNQEGYRSNANRLLLWNAIIKLKKSGFEWFDLGGIDEVNTKNIAEFKIGSGCELFQYVGEYMVW